MSSEHKNTIINIFKNLNLINDDTPVASHEEWFEVRKLIWNNVDIIGNVDPNLYDQLDFSNMNRLIIHGFNLLK